MPLYEYKCHTCGKTIEVLQKFSDEPLTIHEGCGGDVERLISASAFHLKGSGWYVTDYAKSNGETKTGAEKTAEGKKAEEKTGDAKPAETSSTPASSAESKNEAKPAATETKPSAAPSSDSKA